MGIPLTQDDWLRAVALETAKMSYPGSMSRGKKPVVKEGTRKSVENYFSGPFPIKSIWSNPAKFAKTYEQSHSQWAMDLGRFIRIGSPGNIPETIAAKFIDTFMHQLMKYEEFRPLWKSLHLPLDSRVLQSLKKLRNQTESGTAISNILKRVNERTAYKLSYAHYEFIQEQLSYFILELNDRKGTEVKFTSRIELNWLWLDHVGITPKNRHRYKMSELMAKFKPEHRHGEWNIGDPVGKEVW